MNINKQYEWVIGVNFFESKEDNLKKDDGIYFDPLYYEVPYIDESSLSSNFLVNNFSIFGNLNYLINQSTKLTIGARWEDSESQYADSLGESFNPSDIISGGKVSINKILDKDIEVISAEGPPGCAIITDGRVWHGTGANITKDNRLALLITFCGC